MGFRTGLAPPIVPLCGELRVSDGTRTRDHRDHNQACGFCVPFCVPQRLFLAL